MNRSDIKSIITLSNPNFYKKIIQKYQTGKRNTSRFPRMIFYKERGHIVPQKISVILKFRLHLDKQTILSSLIMKNLTESKKILKPLFLAVNAVFYHQTLHTVPSDIEAVNPHVLNYESNTKILGLQIFREKLKYRPLYIVRNSTFIGKGNKPENKSPAINLSKQNGVPFLIEKNTSVIKGMILGLNTEKKNLQLVVKLKNTRSVTDVTRSVTGITKNVTDVTNIFLTALKIPRMYQITSGLFPTEHSPINKVSVFSLLKSAIFRVGNVTTESNKLLKYFFSDIKTAASQQKFYRIYSSNKMFSPEILNYEYDMQSLNSQIFKEKINRGSLNLARHSTFTSEKNILKNQSAFENKLPVILLKDNLLFKNTDAILNRDFFKGSNWVAVNEPLMKNYHDNFGHGTSSPVQSIHAYKIGHERLLFHEQGRLEQEIEQIKKIIIETKESVLKKMAAAPGEADLKRHLDINRISDQVYQNIERTIRMERERRGF